MTISSTDLSTIDTQLASLQQSLSKVQNSGSTPELNSFFSSLLAVETAATQVVSALSAGGSTSSANSSAGASSSSSGVSGSLSTQTISALLNATSVTSLSNSTDSTQAVGTPHLLPTGSSPELSDRPSVGQFMQITGADLSTASDVIYGTIGSNTDLRDWSAIMKSGNPLADARASTAALYNSSLDYASSDAAVPEGTVVAKSGNFAYANLKTPVPGDPAHTTPTLVALDGKGNQLTTFANAQDLATRGANFGFSTSSLATLSAALDAQGVNYKANGWPNGFTGST